MCAVGRAVWATSACLAERDGLADGARGAICAVNGGGVGRVSSSSLWSCSCSWPRSCSGARGIAATNAYGSEMACFAYVSNGVVERSGSTVAFVFVLYAPPVPFTCALRIAAAVTRAMPCRYRGEGESVDVGNQVGLQALTPVRCSVATQVRKPRNARRQTLKLEFTNPGEHVAKPCQPSLQT